MLSQSRSAQGMEGEDAMSPADRNDRDSDDAVASEYVLGALPAHRRRSVARRIGSDPDFARLVDHWATLLAPMANASPRIDPDTPRRAWGARGPARRTRALLAATWTSLSVWRIAALTALTALVLVLIAPQGAVRDPEILGVSLEADGSHTRFLGVYAAREGVVRLSHVSGSPPRGHAFELWVIAGEEAPRSLGVIASGDAHVRVAPALRAHLREGAVLAISLEPPGGSVNGRVTGPLVAAGDLRMM